MMSINGLRAADLASLLLKHSCADCLLNDEVSIVLERIGPAPISLTGLAFQHVLP